MQQSTSLPSRIKDSAAGLTKDLLSNSIRGCASATTNELAALRNAHKLACSSSYYGSLPRLPRPLHDRHQNSNDHLPSSSQSLGLDADLDTHNELSEFLSQECNIGTSASSSRSGSTSDLTLDSEDGSLHLRRNDNFEPDLSRAKQKSPARSSYEGFHRAAPILNSHDQNEYLERSVSGANWNKQELRVDIPQLFAIGEAQHAETAARRKERALNRLQLISTHLPAATSLEENVKFKQTDTSESSYNQLCGGENAQEWAEFEASLFHGYGMQATGQDGVQTMRHEQSTSAATSRQAHPLADTQMNHIAHRLSRPKRPASQQDSPDQDTRTTKDKDDMPEFHCPWIDCHTRFQMCADYIQETDSLTSLSCVHTGCELEFATEEVWRQHVSIAHHNLLPRCRPVQNADMEAVWNRVEA